MLLLMDEYGDTGLKLDAGSSRWLIITASVFATRELADECGKQIKKLHETLGGREFHFTHDNQNRKEHVFGLLATLPFTYHFVACDKRLLRLRDWKPNDLYEEVAGQLIDALKPGLEKCTVWFDTLGGKKSDKAYGQRLTKRAGFTPDGPASSTRSEWTPRKSRWVSSRITFAVRSVARFVPKRRTRTSTAS